MRAAACSEHVLVRSTVHNRGPETARLHVLPTLWFRNTRSRGIDDRKPSMRKTGTGTIEVWHHDLGTYALVCDGSPEVLFTENESNAQRLSGTAQSVTIREGCVPQLHRLGAARRGEPANVGTKAAAHYILDVPGGGTQTVRVRLAGAVLEDRFRDFDQVFTGRIADGDEFYAPITPRALNDDARLVHRQALAGMLWSKQYYYFDLEQWLSEHKSHPLSESPRGSVRTPNGRTC